MTPKKTNHASTAYDAVVSRITKEVEEHRDKSALEQMAESVHHIEGHARRMAAKQEHIEDNLSDVNGSVQGATAAIMLQNLILAIAGAAIACPLWKIAAALTAGGAS